MKKTYIDILKPDDWHVHLREGQILSTVLPFTYNSFASALIMPNLENPITDISLAETIMMRSADRYRRKLSLPTYDSLFDK